MSWVTAIWAMLIGGCMAMAFLHLLVGIWQRGGAFTTKKEGLGMSLAIVRSIIETHGGRIDGENDDDGGALFHFNLPASWETV